MFVITENIMKRPVLGFKCVVKLHLKQMPIFYLLPGL